MASIASVVTVCRDGWHNGFTDLLYWRNAYWVCYRKGSSHDAPDGRATLAVSTDRQRFREVTPMPPAGDNRDPKFVQLSPERIALIIPSYPNGCNYRDERKQPDLRQFITFSNDGYHWEEPRQILERNEWLWRVREHNGLYYALVNRIGGGGLHIYTSRDLLDWSYHAPIGEPPVILNECDILWQEDGEAWLIARSRGVNGYFATAKPPYTHWLASELKMPIHAPVFFRHKEEIYVAGRNFPRTEGDSCYPLDWEEPWGQPCINAGLALWKVSRNALTRVLQIPAAGDCAYPGVTQDMDSRLWISWYSQHAYLCAGVPSLPDQTTAMPKSLTFFSAN